MEVISLPFCEPYSHVALAKREVSPFSLKHEEDRTNIDALCAL
jgi:hypothetical protein